MENLYYNLSEVQFSKGRKAILWIFVILFFLAGVYVLILSYVIKKETIQPILSLAPFSISLIVAIIAYYSTVKRKDLFFSIDDEKIEFRYGLFHPGRHSFKWVNIRELIMTHKQKKAKLLLKNGTSFVINLTWLQRQKANDIQKHIYYGARAKNLNVIKVRYMPKKS
ncbi:MAG: hypothetical protein MUO72_03655 [Bacteroidales bacterium]|nr:hypothetical protein [Bacteroidales bacterium]